MIRILIASFIAVSLLSACSSIRTMPVNYYELQKKQRPHMLAVFMDGTRDRPHTFENRNSHVLRSYYLRDTGIKSLYLEGVGPRFNFKDGKQAVTTRERVMKAYRFLAENYQSANDSICLFGFSRGANQCRILSSIIYTIGIIDLKQINECERQRLLLRVYDLYVVSGTQYKKRNLAAMLNGIGLRHSQHYDTTGTTKITLMGLWDTVEALKINDHLETTTPLPQHLNQLYNVQKLYHALSLDDNRAFNYTPILATHQNVAYDPRQNLDSIVEEVWFNGSHKDVGGGVRKKKNNQLSHISFQWMLARTEAYHLFNKPQYKPDIFGNANNMRKGWANKKTSPCDTLRAINKYWAEMNPSWNGHRIKVHQSVIDRLDSGIVQPFKLIYKDGSKRLDWYDWEPFKNCFEKDTTQKPLRIKFKEKACSCIEVVNDSTSIKLQAKNGVSVIPVIKKPNEQNENTISVVYKMEESFIPCLLPAEALRQSVLNKAFEGKLI